MSGVATAIAGSAVLGAIVSKNNSDRAASAQGDIANAQLGQQREDRGLALKYAEATPEELAQLNKSIQLNQQDIDRKQKLLDSADPALIEAGSQALKLLKGEDAKVIAPLKANIAKQEQKLREKLQAQLGPGWETTTAGQQALAAFNEQANNSITSAQQGSLGQLLGVAQDTAGRYGMQSNISNAGTLSQTIGAESSRKVSAINGTPISGAGAQFIGDLQSARGSQQTLGNAIGAIGTGVGNLYAGGYFNPSKASPTANNPFDGSNGIPQAADNSGYGQITT